jgi:SAM-dependent methyltransferase
VAPLALCDDRGRYAPLVTDPGAIVREGFDALGERYLVWQLENEEDPRRPYLERFMNELPNGARVLDLGCGPGVPATRLLVERFDLTGVDFSAAQVELARSRVPEARFIEADLCEVDFPRGAFDGVTSLFAVSHTPRAGHEGLFRRIAGWLRPGGLFLVNFRAGERNDLIYEWGGVRMYASNYDAETNRRLLRQTGFELIVDEIAVLRSSSGDVPYLWVMGATTAPPEAVASSPLIAGENCSRFSSVSCKSRARLPTRR